MYKVTAGEKVMIFTRKEDAKNWLAGEILHVYPVTSMTAMKRLSHSLIDLNETVWVNGVEFAAKTTKKTK